MHEAPTAATSAISLSTSMPSETLNPSPSLVLPPAVSPAADKCSVSADRRSTPVHPEVVDGGGAFKGLGVWLPKDRRLHSAGP